MTDSERLKEIERLAEIAAEATQSVVREFAPMADNRTVMGVSVKAFRDYYHHVKRENIELPEGKYEPHALYFRTWMMRRLRAMERSAVFVDYVMKAEQTGA